jgi:hypothetical protein
VELGNVHYFIREGFPSSFSLILILVSRLVPMLERPIKRLDRKSRGCTLGTTTMTGTI